MAKKKERKAPDDIKNKEFYLEILKSDLFKQHNNDEYRFDYTKNINDKDGLSIAFYAKDMILVVLKKYRPDLENKLISPYSHEALSIQESLDRIPDDVRLFFIYNINLLSE